MRTKNKLQILILFVTALLISCDSLVDVKPKGFMIPETAADLRMMLNNLSGNFRMPRPVTIGYDLIKYAGDQVEFKDSEPLESNAENVYAYYMRDKKLIEEHNHGDIIYMYQLVAIANAVLDILPATNDLSEKERNQIKGEALVHRAYAFLTMVNIHARHYDKNTASTDLGIPMPLNHDINMNIPERSTVKKVYDLVIDDLSEAVNLMGELSDIRALPSKAGAHALLARTYLFMGDFEKALSNANQALESSDFLYNLEDYLANDGSLNVPLRDFTSKESFLHKEVSREFRGSAKRYVSDDFLALYAKGDLRAKYYTERKGSYYYANYPESFSGILISEMLLTRAECHARKGNLTLALQDINKIRMHRFTDADYVELVSSDKEEVMRWVLRERKIELAWVGLRWFDMKRLNKEQKYQMTLTRTYKGKNLVFEPNSDLWVFPFPGSILEKGIVVQNP
jgi:tetratricopeptide (TPR) repeat protein